MVMLFSMIFAAVVGGGIYFTWRRGRAASEGRLPISDRPGRAGGQPLAALLFGGFFLLGGGLVCYVNPADPAEAVLERGFTPTLWFGLIPFTFAVVGAVGLALTVRRRRPTGSATTLPGTGVAFGDPAVGPVAAPYADGVPGQLALKPRTAPWAKLLGAIFAAVFWNGIVSVFVAQAVASWRAGRPDWTLTLFMIPFVLIGLGLIVGIFYFLLALSNPRPRITLSPAAVPLGGVLRVGWDLEGRTEVLQNLSVYLEGREEAKYRRGTDTLTDTASSGSPAAKARRTSGWHKSSRLTAPRRRNRAPSASACPTPL